MLLFPLFAPVLAQQLHQVKMASSWGAIMGCRQVLQCPCGQMTRLLFETCLGILQDFPRSCRRHPGCQDNLLFCHILGKHSLIKSGQRKNRHCHSRIPDNGMHCPGLCCALQCAVREFWEILQSTRPPRRHGPLFLLNPCCCQGFLETFAKPQFITERWTPHLLESMLNEHRQSKAWSVAKVSLNSARTAGDVFFPT